MKNIFLKESLEKSEKLLIDIAKARIEEIAKIILYKNINTVTFRKKCLNIFNN